MSPSRGRSEALHVASRCAQDAPYASAHGQYRTRNTNGRLRAWVASRARRWLSPLGTLVFLGALLASLQSTNAFLGAPAIPFGARLAVTYNETMIAIGQYGNSFNATTPIRLTPRLSVLANTMSTWAWSDKTPLNTPTLAPDVVATVGGIAYASRFVTDTVTNANTSRQLAYVAFSLYSISRGDHSGTQVAILDMTATTREDPWTWLGYIGPPPDPRFLAGGNNSSRVTYSGGSPSCFDMSISLAPPYPVETAGQLFIAGGYNCTGPGNGPSNTSKEIWVTETADLMGGMREGWNIWSKINFLVPAGGYTHVVTASTSMLFLNFGEPSVTNPTEQNASRLLLTYDFLTGQEYDLTKSCGMPWPEGTNKGGVAVTTDGSKVYVFGGYGYFSLPGSGKYVVSDGLYIMDTASPVVASVSANLGGGRSTRQDGYTPAGPAVTSYTTSSSPSTWRWSLQQGVSFDSDGISSPGGGPGAYWNSEICAEKNHSVLMIWGGVILPPTWNTRETVPDILEVPSPWPYPENAVTPIFSFIETKSWQWVAEGPYYIIPGTQLSPGAIAGIVVGATAFAVFIVGFGIYAGRKAAEEERNKRRKYRRWWEDPRVWGDSGYFGPDGPMERAMRESMGMANITSTASDSPLLDKRETAALKKSISTVIPGLTEVEHEKGRAVQQEVAKQEKEKEAAEKGEKKGIFGGIFSNVNGNLATALAGVAASNGITGANTPPMVSSPPVDPASLLPPKAAPVLKSSGSYVSKPLTNGTANGVFVGSAMFANGQNAGYNLDGLRGVECRVVLPKTGMLMDEQYDLSHELPPLAADRSSSLLTLVGEWLHPNSKSSHSSMAPDSSGERRLSTSGLSVGSRNSIDIRFIRERDSVGTAVNGSVNGVVVGKEDSKKSHNLKGVPHRLSLENTKGTKLRHTFPESAGGMVFDELTLNVGDRVLIREAFADGWAVGVHLTSDQVGAFPLNHVIRI
ncbi:hypothetical protein M427DRAFT_50854 [Gonapodya prolifera JEL478]|uniref:SH3 domain-containing protein n=1 Tax=Gonapodya prolifera (strain JEL478) TaxID=1344416 RepID=A0A139B0N2_GONPJ|nr:hypothetical protein M427DRAFT_50854 [Gonapodya prolifera JEL478]|eukprot:KXS22556.1 hypothetical protein M427DRAFT_50854 [Gonapodya prolifera JEL478]